MIFSLLTFISLLIYIYIAWPKEAGQMQTDRSTNRQTNDLWRLRQRIGEQTERQTINRQGAGSAKSSAYYIPVLTPDAASRPAASLPLVHAIMGVA